MRYRVPDPGLHTELFVKIPHGKERLREKYLCGCIYAQDEAEVRGYPLCWQRVQFRQLQMRCTRTTWCSDAGHATLPR